MHKQAGHSETCCPRPLLPGGSPQGWASSHGTTQRQASALALCYTLQPRTQKSESERKSIIKVPGQTVSMSSTHPPKPGPCLSPGCLPQTLRAKTEVVSSFTGKETEVLRG